MRKGFQFVEIQQIKRINEKQKEGKLKINDYNRYNASVTQGITRTISIL